MSRILVEQYLNELADLERVAGTRRETVVRRAFKSLLKGRGRSRDLTFVPKCEYITSAKERRCIERRERLWCRWFRRRGGGS